MNSKTRLNDYMEKYEISKASFSSCHEKFKEWLEQFEGSKKIGKGKEAEAIYNFTKELIEAQINSTVPMPAVQPRTPTEQNRALTDNIIAMLRNEMDRLPMEQLNDQDERTTRIMGGGLYLIEWDNSQKTHNTVGELNVRLINPLEFVPQKGVYDLNAMDYCFLVFNDTKSRIKARYGKNVSEESTDSSQEQADDMVTQIICYYHNNKGGVGCISWVGETLLVDDDNYFARKDKVCVKCGKTKPMGEAVCICGSKQWETRERDYETLTEDIVKSDGTIIPAMSPARDDNGNIAYEDYEEQLIDIETGLPVYDYVFNDFMEPIGEQPRMEVKQRIAFEPTKIPYYVPSQFPLALRKNTSSYQSFFGGSDCNTIKEQQLQSNKATTKIAEKLVGTSEFFTKPDDLKFDVTNEGISVLNVQNPAQISMIKAKSLQFSTASENEAIERAYYQAKSQLAVSDTFQGKADNTATSGKAKEIQVAQAAGIQSSKRIMKNAAYAKLFEMAFKFMLAYSDDPRSYTATDENGVDVEKVFNRIDYLVQDEYGNWYYYDEFLFSVDEAGAMQSDKQFLLQDVRTDFSMGAFGDPSQPETMLTYWKEKEVIGYPNAKRMVKHWQDKMQEQQAMQEQQEQLEQQAMLQQKALIAQQQPQNMDMQIGGIIE